MADMLDNLLFPGDDTITDAPDALDTLDMPGGGSGLPGGGDLLDSAGVARLSPRPPDAPVPGQSLTQSPDQPLPYERPPQFTNEEEASHAIFMAMTEKEELSKVLQLLDAGVPVSIIAQSIITFGASEGKWNMDMSLLLLEPVMVMLAGVGSQAGINFTMAPPEKDPEVLDTAPLRKIFKDKLGKKKESLGSGDAEKATEQVASMIKRPGSDASAPEPMGDALAPEPMGDVPTPELIGDEPLLTPKGII